MPKPDLDISSVMPMVRLARTAGQGAILGAKNKLDSLRAEDPIAYDTAVLRERNFSETSKRVNPAMRAKANEPMYEQRENAAGDTYKKGGKVKATASSRADGIAKRGKTRGRMV